MTSASTLEGMSPGLLKGVERAQREPEGQFHSLAHLIDIAALKRAYHRQRPSAAVGVDGVTKEQYGQNHLIHANAQNVAQQKSSKNLGRTTARNVATY